MAHDGCCVGSGFSVTGRGGNEVTFSRLPFPVYPAVLSAFFYDKANAFQLPDGACIHLFVALQYDFEPLFYILWVCMDFFVDDRHVPPFFLYFSFLSMIFQLLSEKKLHEKKHGFSRAKSFICISWIHKKTGRIVCLSLVGFFLWFCNQISVQGLSHDPGSFFLDLITIFIQQG